MPKGIGYPRKKIAAAKNAAARKQAAGRSRKDLERNVEATSYIASERKKLAGLSPTKLRAKKAREAERRRKLARDQRAAKRDLVRRPSPLRSR